MLRGVVLFLLCLLAAAAVADVEIIGLPEAPDARYDLSWTMSVGRAPAGALVLQVEMHGGQGYTLRWAQDRLSWQQAGKAPAFAPVTVPLTLTPQTTVHFSIKRREDTIAVLRNHRLLFVAPAPSQGTGTTTFAQMPSGCTIDEARYQEMERPAFGDDFMRPEGQRHLAPNSWVEDATWRVAYYRTDYPGDDPRDPVSGETMAIPWGLSLYATPDSTANGFWYRYSGMGPSWVVAHRTFVSPACDQYFVEAAVKPEYDSEVGLIAAYQDNANYLLFRWKQRTDVPNDQPRAELIAVMDGTPRVLAASPRGFEPAQWYAMRINLGWQVAQVLIDDEPLLSAQNPGAIEGRVGLFAHGVENPPRPKLDEVTATMYVTRDADGRTLNDAADALRADSLILFDDVRVGEWMTSQSTAVSSPYVATVTGEWKLSDTVSSASKPGSVISGPALSSYTLTTRLRLPARGSAALLFHLDAGGNGYAWTMSEGKQRLRRMAGYRLLDDEVDSAAIGLRANEWTDLRVEADGPYVRLFCNDRPVMEAYDARTAAGRSGVQAFVRGVSYTPLVVTAREDPRPKPDIHDRFTTDKWLVTWSSPEADWYPAFTPKTYLTPAGMPHDQIGRAAPLPTDQPGLYWHKGGHYHDLCVTFPAFDAFSGQILHLATDYDPERGYSVQFTTDAPGQCRARLSRSAAVVQEYPFTMTARSRMIFQRLGGFLVLRVQDLELDEPEADADVIAERLVFAYRDRAPLLAEMIGLTVTEAKLPAAKLVVDSDRIEDPFEYAPTGWIAESGVWAVMARYTCQPQWNWFGGFGPYTPTVWSKMRLDGDQVVEAYLGIKMQFDNQPEEYAARYRDVNMTICADGAYINSGYSVVRAGRPGGKNATLLLRQGQIVQRITDQPEFLLPGQDQGHRQWFVTRMEKRGDTIKVFIDNRLAMTYTDPQPLPGGYAGIWTLNNGIMIGRANLSAQQMRVGAPRAAQPLAVQEQLDPLPLPQVTVNEASYHIATFEQGLDEAKERGGLTARIVRERVTDAATGPNTFLKVVNMYPAGDFSATLLSAPRDLRARPHLHFDYCFDPGVSVNLYLRRQNTWYEFLLTGVEAQAADVVTGATTPVRVIADGRWRHFAADMGALLAEAIACQTGAPATDADLRIQELIIADWGAEADLRHYGFGRNRGGLAARFDNIAFVPALTGPVTLSWQMPEATAWRMSVDASPTAQPRTQTTDSSTRLTLPPGLHYAHVQMRDAHGTWQPTVHIPLPVAAAEK